MCLMPSDACVLCSHLLVMGICCWERRTTIRVADPTPAGGSAPCSSDPAAAATASADRHHGGRVQMPPRSWNSLQVLLCIITQKKSIFVRREGI